MLNPAAAIATLSLLNPSDRVVSSYKTSENFKNRGGPETECDLFEKILGQVERQLQGEGVCGIPDRAVKP
ncbi:MAG: hypothetical protein HQL67_02380 [Magnetococcales bacterium]|nr:hypothetical protein [Magnetococcales bacterium]